MRVHPLDEMRDEMYVRDYDDMNEMNEMRD